MAQVSYWTASAYQAALGAITTPTTKFEDISDTDVSTFEDGGLKTGGATNSNITALWDLGSDQTVTDMYFAWNGMDLSEFAFEYSTAAQAGTVWTAVGGFAPASGFGAPSNALADFSGSWGGFSTSARYWRLSIRDTPFNYIANTRVQLGTFRLYNSGLLYTTIGGGFDPKLASAFMTFF